MTRRARWIALAAGVLLGAVGYWAVEVRTRTGAERVKDMVDWDDSCKSVELSKSRGRLPDYALVWKRTEERAFMWCPLGESIVYARFASDDALRRAVEVSPPLTRLCEIPGRKLRVDLDSLDRVGGGPAFRRRCERRGGKIILEETERYCAAGDELLVDGFDGEPGFEEVCDELDGRLARAPKSVLER